MKQSKLVELANKAIARWNDPDLPELPGSPVVKIVASKLASELEIHPQVIATYLGTTSSNKHVYNIPASAIIEYFS
ncbi:MAG: hypothetical protein KME60_03250 [Cyanomargarita calcarea GSE-NOS-MK-12-04C]|jgi:hypothetical protein|uniref:Uncharacterized protein n=1 Tax=Cyanomargarita calcarea GSE-NOS-MK-12-04C TaxID=2839659 RepID=A0A951QK57_9CYAN|nr:hypothetical protein [Cyanomargarita calcarea GSE-NOS-MK-12-04C]